MPDNYSRLLTLAKVLIATAWADGEISIEEKNCLKDIIFHILNGSTPLNAHDWSLLEMYMDSPIEEAERARLVADLQDSIRSPAEREMVLDALEQMMMADGVAGSEEERIVQEIERAVNESDVGLMDSLNRLLGGALQRRSSAVANAPNREAYYDDFLKNKVYYEVSRHLREEGRSLDLSDAELRKLGLAGGLMARIAKVDRVVSDDERQAMIQLIEEHWQLMHEAAVFVANTAISSLDYTYDYYRMTREFATNTTREERQRFLVVLFLIAAADGSVSFDETEEIRLVSRSINLTHQDFINAKLEAQAK
ncbi:MAG: TerB family tellurite resistance protein [Candidatus Promineifilaceae bacterium]|nr:TerB family tellurite resistance protein [Candidatus Promineifilaceae bacterium]